MSQQEDEDAKHKAILEGDDSYMAMAGRRVAVIKEIESVQNVIADLPANTDPDARKRLNERYYLLIEKSKKLGAEVDARRKVLLPDTTYGVRAVMAQEELNEPPTHFKNQHGQDVENPAYSSAMRAIAGAVEIGSGIVSFTAARSLEAYFAALVSKTCVRIKFPEKYKDFSQEQKNQFDNEVEFVVALDARNDSEKLGTQFTPSVFAHSRFR